MISLDRLHGISIRWKLAMLITLVSAIALLAVAIALLFQDTLAFRRTFSREIATLAEIMATNTEVAVVFDDEEAAVKTLDSLTAQPRVLLARLYSGDGTVFATYSRGEPAVPFESCRSSNSAKSFARSVFSVNRDIVWQEKTIGRLCIVASTAEINAHLRDGLEVTGIVLLAALGATFLLSMTFQKLVSNPILELAEAAEAISRKEYNIRVSKRSDDELGVLTETFNRMVSQISVRDAALVEARRVLELQVGELHREISERERAEEALLKSEEALRQVQKMEAVGQLAGGIAHDFNNLMTAVIGYSELIAGEADQSESIRFRARQILGAGKRAAVLTRHLLAFSRKQILKPEVINLNTRITGMRDMLDRLVGEDTVFKLGLSPDLGSVWADPSQIEQVLLNLVVNARDAIPASGVIEIKTEMADCPSAGGSVRGAEEKWVGRCVKLSVRDTGCGMDAETQEKIFEPFFTTKDQGKGTGLGLSTVFGIVKQTGGQIAVDSRVGEGSTIAIYLPQAARDSDSRSDAVGAAGRHSSADEQEFLPGYRSGTILVVDDEQMIRAIATATLDQEGYTVLEAENGEAAVELSRSYSKPIDLLLTDVVMPGMNGHEAAMRVAEGRPEMRTLFMSGYTNLDVVRKGVLVEGVDLVHKPFSPDQLRRRVAEVLGEKRRGSGHAGLPPNPALVQKATAAFVEQS